MAIHTEPAAARTLAGRLARAWTAGDDEEWEATLRAYERVVDEDRLTRQFGDASAARAEFDRRYRAFVRGGERMHRSVDELARLLDLALAPPDAAEPTGALLVPREQYIALRAKCRAWLCSAARALLAAMEVYRTLPAAERYKAAATWGPILDDTGHYACWRRVLPVDRLDALDLRAHWLDPGSPYHGLSRALLDIARLFQRAETPEAWREAVATARARGADERRWARFENAARDRLVATGRWRRDHWPREAAEQATFVVDGEG